MLNIVRGLLYVDDLIYANGNKFICSTAVHPEEGWRIAAANYTPPARRLYLLLPRYAVFYPGYDMNYMQRGHYAVVVNPLSYSLGYFQ